MVQLLILKKRMVFSNLKAFDTVDWDFLDSILRAKGFGRVGYKWIHGYISRQINFFLSFINSKLHGKIINTLVVSNKVFRFSPFLFIWALQIVYAAFGP